MEQLIPKSILWTNQYEHWRSHPDSVPSDIKRFLRSAFWLEEDLFRANDLICATSESLARVARTIIFLVHSVKPNTICSELFWRLRSGKRPHKPLMPTCHQSTSDQSLAPSDFSPHSNSSSLSNLSIYSQPLTTSSHSPPNQPTSNKSSSNKSSSPPSNNSPPSSQSSSQTPPPNLLLRGGPLQPRFQSPLKYRPSPGCQSATNQPPTDKVLEKKKSRLQGSHP